MIADAIADLTPADEYMCLSAVVLIILGVVMWAVRRPVRGGDGDE